jgi:hypothetical protein
MHRGPRAVAALVLYLSLQCNSPELALPSGSLQSSKSSVIESAADARRPLAEPPPMTLAV